MNYPPCRAPVTGTGRWGAQAVIPGHADDLGGACGLQGLRSVGRFEGVGWLVGGGPAGEEAEGVGGG